MTPRALVPAITGFVARLRSPNEPTLLLALALAASIAGCGGPVVLFPGGALEGQAAETPDSWAFTDAVTTVQLETRPATPTR